MLVYLAYELNGVEFFILHSQGEIRDNERVQACAEAREDLSRVWAESSSRQPPTTEVSV